jgi:hypothetical protein
MNSFVRLCAFLLLSPCFLFAQENISLDDMSFWKSSNQNNWQIAGDVRADLNKNEWMQTTPGKGVLVNLPNDKNKANLLSEAEFGDVDVSFDFMMATHSNSGFYLQGRYEVQLLDSWGVRYPRYGDCGGIYARRRFVPKTETYEGHAPRQNACLAPGLWQHMDISFQAPRFDAAGNKTANARMLSIRLNGVLIHENVELTGPTGGPISEQEAAFGPFMIQGDHGPVAFRNMTVQKRSGQPPVLGPVQYTVWHGKYRQEPEFMNLQHAAAGTTDRLSWKVTGQEDEYAVRYNTQLSVPVSGLYKFTLQIGGRSVLRVDGKELLSDAWTYSGDRREASVQLSAGKVPLELIMTKMDNWMPPMLGLWIEGPGTRPTAFHDFNSALALSTPDPIYLEAKEPVVFRAFMDIAHPGGTWGKDRHRVVHAVHVGDPAGLHYSYDLDNGALFQVWKGDFLSTSPMWDNRGDGSSRPRGTLLPLGDLPLIVTEAGAATGGPAKAGEATTLERMREAFAFKPLGYDLDPEGRPAFRYQMLGADITDQIRVQDGGKYLTRTVTATGLPTGKSLLYRLASGTLIEPLDANTWLVDGRRYYLQAAGGPGNARLENAEGKMFLVAPVTEKLEYSIFW